MNHAAASPGPFVRQPWIRVSDQERDSVVKVLQEAYADGRLDDRELDLRVDQALGARTYAELYVPTQDLVPPARPYVPRQYAPRMPYRAPTATTGERVSALIVHWSGYLTFFIAPMIVYLAEGRRQTYLKHQAAQAANFHLTVLIATVVASAASFLVLPVLLLPIIWVAWLVLPFAGGVAAAAGASFRYPLTLRIFG